MTVDGTPATLAADGSFASMVTLKEGSNVIAIRATAKSGSSSDALVGVIAGTFGSSVKEAVEARVTNDALKVATKALEPLLLMDVQKLARTRVAQYSVSPFGATITKDEAKTKLCFVLGFMASWRLSHFPRAAGARVERTVVAKTASVAI